MSAAAYIGRVGGLAVALGVGAAIFSNQGVALADSTSSSDGSSSSSSSDSPSDNGASSSSSDSAASNSGAGSSASDSSVGTKPDASEKDGEGGATSAPTGKHASGYSHSAAENRSGTTHDTEDKSGPTVVETEDSVDSDTSDTQSAAPTPTTGETLNAAETILGEAHRPSVDALPVVDVPATTPTLVESTSVPVAVIEATPEPVGSLSTVITDFLSGTTPTGATSDVPLTPGDSPIAAALLALARRESSASAAAVSSAAATSLVAAQVSATAAINPLTTVTNSVLSVASPLFGPNASSLAVPLQLIYQIPVIGQIVHAGVALLAGPIEALSRIPLVGPVIRAFAVAAGLLPSYTSQVDAQDFTSAAQLRAWHQQLDALGLRATGNAAQEQYIDDLIGMLRDAGLNPADITTQNIRFQQWSLVNPEDPNAYQLNLIAADGTVTRIDAPAYMPYSGVTDAQGRTAQFVYLSDLEDITAESVGGKIVLFDVPLTEIPEPLFLLLQHPGAVYDPNNEILSGGTYKRPYLNGIVPVVEQLQEAGALGAVGVLDYPKDAVTGSYFPYDGILRDIPGVFVDREVGAQLKEQAAQGVTANVVMNAQVKEATTRNIVAVIKGKNYGTAADEVVMIHSHTDGTNGLEDNGPYMTVAMSQYLNRIPQAERESTYVVFLSSGHFAGGNGIRYFTENPDTAENTNHDLYADIIAKTKAAMTIEHVGALEYDEVNGQMVPTGNYEPGVWWSQDNAGMINGAYTQLEQAGMDPSGVLLPLGEVLGTPDGRVNAIWPGEGQYLQAGGINDINYITGPTYLLNYGITTDDKVDFDRVRAAAISMTDQALNYGGQSEWQLTSTRGLFGLGPVGFLTETGILGRILGSIGIL